MASETGRFYVVGLNHLTASVIPARCHHPGCPNIGEYGIVQDFGVPIVPLAVTPLCRIHFHEWAERQTTVPRSEWDNI